MKMTKGIMTAMIVGLFSAGALAAVPVESGNGLQKWVRSRHRARQRCLVCMRSWRKKPKRREQARIASWRPGAKTRCTAWRLSTSKSKNRRLSLLFAFLFRRF